MSTGGESQPVAEARRKSREPWMHAHEKSDEAIVPKKGPKAGQPGEVLEGRAEAKGNMQSAPMLRTQSRDSVSRGLLRVRQRARPDHSWPDELFSRSTRGGSPVQEICPPGSVRGATRGTEPHASRSYRDERRE